MQRRASEPAIIRASETALIRASETALIKVESTSCDDGVSVKSDKQVSRRIVVSLAKKWTIRLGPLPSEVEAATAQARRDEAQVSQRRDEAQVSQHRAAIAQTRKSVVQQQGQLSSCRSKRSCLTNNLITHDDRLAQEADRILLIEDGLVGTFARIPLSKTRTRPVFPDAGTLVSQSSGFPPEGFHVFGIRISTLPHKCFKSFASASR